MAVPKYDSYKGCSHGKTYQEPCLLCEKISLEDSIAIFQKIVDRDKARLLQVIAELGEGHVGS